MAFIIIGTAVFFGWTAIPRFMDGEYLLVIAASVIFGAIAVGCLVQTMWSRHRQTRERRTAQSAC